MTNYTPRRCSARWLDGDCPREVLCIFAYPDEPTPSYDVFYAETYAHDDPRGPWIGYLDVDYTGAFAHGEMRAHEVAAYRYRMKHRYFQWSLLPDAVKAAVRFDLARAAQA
jgi:hypothetical protein